MSIQQRKAAASKLQNWTPKLYLCLSSWVTKSLKSSQEDFLDSILDPGRLSVLPADEGDEALRLGIKPPANISRLKAVTPVPPFPPLLPAELCWELWNSTNLVIQKYNMNVRVCLCLCYLDGPAHGSSDRHFPFEHSPFVSHAQFATAGSGLEKLVGCLDWVADLLGQVPETKYSILRLINNAGLFFRQSGNSSNCTIYSSSLCGN